MSANVHSLHARLTEIRRTAAQALAWLRSHRRGVLGLTGLVLALYLPTLGYDFLNWDDPWYVVNNPLIRSWHPANLWRIATEVVARNYAPLTIFSLLIDHTLWGLWPGGYHLTNLLLHALNAVLVYALILQLSGSRSVACLAAALWAVHPVQVETVAWVSSRKGLLSGSFLLASALCWLRPDRTGRHEVWGLLWFLLALLSKAVAVVFPAVVLAYDLLVRRRRPAEALSRQVVPGFFAVWLLLTTTGAQNSVLGGVRAHFALSKLEILAVDLVILWRYAAVLIWPADLCVLYDPPTSGIASAALMCGAAWSAVAFWIYRFRRHHPLVALSLVAWVAFLVPVLNLFPITTLMNDRYLYLPSIPVFALAAAGVQRLLALAAGGTAKLRSQKSEIRSQKSGDGAKAHGWQAVGTTHAPSHPQPPTAQHSPPTTHHAPRSFATFAFSAALILAYAAATSCYLPVWRNGVTLWEHANRHVPQLAVVQIQRADTLRSLGRTEEAIRALETALTHCAPDKFDRRRIEERLDEWRNEPIRKGQAPAEPALREGEAGEAPAEPARIREGEAPAEPPAR